MSVKELEERVVALEERVQQISNALAASQRAQNRDWLSAIESFRGDKDLQSIFADAQKLREADRQKTRRQTKRRKPTK